MDSSTKKTYTIMNILFSTAREGNSTKILPMIKYFFSILAHNLRAENIYHKCNFFSTAAHNFRVHGCYKKSTIVNILVLLPMISAPLGLGATV